MRTKLIISLIVFAATCFAAHDTRAQTQKPSPQPTPDDVLRTNTELVQTHVMVFDKAGKFVPGLTRDQFELLIDGQSQPISSFEQVSAGTSKEVRLLSVDKTPVRAASENPVNENRGRTIVFFMDDFHLAPDSLERTRKTLANFIDTEMNENDRVALASTSGDIGFLQQFTDNKLVLRAAATRLTHHPYNVRDLADSHTPMTENMALSIERKDDPGVLDFYIDRCVMDAFPLRVTRMGCEVQVKDRARAILLQAANVTLGTYASLESLMRTAALLPGRKLVFFISDGFLLDTGPRNSDPRDKLRQITDEAVRAGAVIYTIDARGLFSGQLDATNNVPFDPKARIDSTALREGTIAQDVLNALAGDTGGRALRNQNYFDRWVSKILDETSEYYLLAWRPNNQQETQATFKNISVRVTGHPEYTVRWPRGFINHTPTAATATEEVQVPTRVHRDIQQALTVVNPKQELPTALSAVFLDTPDNGIVVTASVQVLNETLTYAETRGKQTAAVDVVGVIVNDHGKPVGSFQTELNVKPLGENGATENSSSIYNARVKLGPGLYQVRVATRDVHSGRVGSAQQWIEIPDLHLKRLALSSLLLGLQSVSEAKGAAAPQVQFSVDHHFARSGSLGFMAFIYNATQGNGAISFQARLLKAGQPLRATPWLKIGGDSTDRTRIICNGEMRLNDLPAGHYTFELTVTDGASNASVTERTRIVLK